LVPGFKEKIPEKRFETAVELSMHPRAKVGWKLNGGIPTGTGENMGRKSFNVGY
jgi:hypothetical protein